MLGVVTVASGRRNSTSAEGRLRVEQDGAALGDHHRVEDDRGIADEREGVANRLDRRSVSEHADLHRVDADVARDRAHLLDDHLGRYRLEGR